MATQTITSKTLYGSYKNGTALASSATDYGYIGYGNSAGTNKYSVCYKMVLPTISGTINSITLTPTIKNCNAGNLLSGKKYKVGVAHSVNTHYASGVSDAYGYWTNTLTLGQNLSSGASYTFGSTKFSSDENAAFSSGETIYVYMYAGESGIISKAELTGWTASIDYTAEAVTGTTLTVGTSSNNVALTTCYPAPTSSSNTRVYYKVSGLANPLNTYEYFKVYLYDGFSFTNGGAISSGTLLTTYTPSSTSTATSFTSTLSVPSSYFKVGAGSVGIVVVAATTAYPDRYWRIGGDGNVPKICYISMNHVKWLVDPIDVYVSNVGKTTATVTVNLNAINSPRYLSNVYLRTAETSSSGATSAAGTSVGSASFASSTATSQSKTIDLTGLPAGAETTYYLTSYGSTSYNSKSYRGIGRITIRTDGDYTSQLLAEVNGSTSATIYMGTPTSQFNLSGDTWTLKDESGNVLGSGYFNPDGTEGGAPSTTDGGIVLSNLSPATEYTVYGYVETQYGNVYQTGSVTFKTHSYVYYTDDDGNLIPCWTYTLLEKTLSGYVHTCVLDSTVHDYSGTGEVEYYYKATINGATYYLVFNNIYSAGEVITINENNEGIFVSDSGQISDIFYTQPSGNYAINGNLEFTSSESTITISSFDKVMLDVPNYVR